MPKYLSRESALDQLNADWLADECIMCKLLSNASKFMIEKGKFNTVVLSKFPRTWGQTMVILNQHHTSFSQTSQEEFNETMLLVRKWTEKLEYTLKPLRCYVASLGATHNLQNTCPHLHFNILPIYQHNDKPETIFTWKHGLLEAENSEWETLINQLQ